MKAFAVVGALGGFAAAVLFEVSLAVLLVPPTAILCALLGYFVASRRHGWAYTIVAVPLAGMANGFTIAFLVMRGFLRDGVEIGAYFSVPFAVTLPLVAYAASKSSTARSASLAGSLQRARLRAVTIMASLALLAVPFVLAPPAMRTHTQRDAAIVWLVVGGLVVYAAVVFARVLAARFRVGEALRTIPLLRSIEASEGRELRDPEYLDLGFGSTQHVYVDATNALRGSPVARVMYEGDPAQVAKLVSSALGFSVVALGSAVALFALVIVRLM